MGRFIRSGVGSIVFVMIVVLSVSVPGVVGGTTTQVTEYVVETQDRIDDDGNLGADENNDDDNYYSSIQTAVNAAPNGALINVTEGVYNETVVVNKPNLVIVGDTGDVRAGAAGNAPIVDSENTKGTAFKLTQNANNVVIKGFQVQNYNNFGITPEVGTSETIENITIQDNTISGVDNGVDLFSSTDDAVFKEITVSRNDISDVRLGINILGSVGVSDMTDVRVSHNVVTNASADGIQVWAGNGDAEIRNLAITENTVDDADRQGIELLIQGDDGDSSITSVEVRDNTITNTDTGVEMRNPSGGTLASVHVSDNELRNNRVGTFVGVETTNDILINYNTYEDNTDFAIETTSDDLLLAENNWYGATSGPTVSSNPGDSGDAVSENVSYDPFLTRVVEIEDGAAPIGNTTTVDVTADAANVAGYELTVKFNETALNVTDVTGADFTDPVVNIDNENGVVTFTQSQDTGVDKPTLARIEFNVTAGGESNVTVDSAETGLYDADGTAISSVSFDKGVLVNSTGGSGDVDGDGDVDAGDVTLLQRYINGEDVSIDTQAADVNGDGNVDAADALDIQEEIVYS